MRGCLTINLKGREMSIHDSLAPFMVRNWGRWLDGRDGCYRYGESGHMRINSTKAGTNVREGKKVTTSDVVYVPPNSIRFYSPRSKGDQEWYSYVPLRYVLP